MNLLLASAVPQLSLGHVMVLFSLLLGTFLCGFYFGYVQGREETRRLHERKTLFTTPPRHG